VGQSRKPPSPAKPWAGISAPLARPAESSRSPSAARDATDTVNFGFGRPHRRRALHLRFYCIPTTTTIAPPTLVGPVVEYVVINRYDTANATLDQTQQLYKDARTGLWWHRSLQPLPDLQFPGLRRINDASEPLGQRRSAICSTTISPAPA